MKNIIILVVLMCCRGVAAASAYWTGFSKFSDINCGEYNGAYVYCFNGEVVGETASSSIISYIYGHKESGGIYFKVEDFSQELNPTINRWALALYGDIIDEMTFQTATQIPFCGYSATDYKEGGVLIKDPTDFYMVFKTTQPIISGENVLEGQSWYGWVHVSVDDSLNMTLLGEGINLYGGPVTVGAIPEPHSALLLLLGGALLALRRRRR